MDGEDASLTGLALDRDVTAVCLRDMFYYGESEASASKLAAAGLVDAVKPLEEAW